jgi:hypothetical protein
MIVYGDAGYDESMPTLVSQLRALIGHSPNSLDDLRALVIASGQVEQAARDYLPFSAIIESIEAATDCAARAFLLRFREEFAYAKQVAAALEQMRSALDSGFALPDVRVRVKVPEGYAFYTLFPEQYVLAAQCWSRANNCTRADAVVLGIRSIGTSLSAIVRATLSFEGWRVHRITVRPIGHPYAREASLPRSDLKDARLALVVDEGPGRSGSSMVSAAKALVAAGMERESISFLPGHKGGPGAAASTAVREWWSTTLTYATPLQNVRWNGRTLDQELAVRTSGIAPRYAEVLRVEDLSGGLWRVAVYADPQQWPAVCRAFERSKYRVVLSDGSAVLWKFAGTATTTGCQTAARATASRLARLAQADWTPSVLGEALGFVAQPWIDGSALTRGEAGPLMLAHMADYISAVAGEPLPPDEQRAAFERLAKMLQWNTREILGGTAAEHTRRFSEQVLAQAEPLSLRACGDGRMAPHEWVLTRPGQILKLDAEGHEFGHTIVGRQPLTWDLAGAIVEWDLNRSEARSLTAATQLHPHEQTAGLIAFHQMAYAAFRIGECQLCAGLDPDDEDEQLRLNAAVAFYTARLFKLIERISVPRARSRTCPLE